MPRPYITCHMHTMLNGKIDGHANIMPEGLRSQEIYAELMLGADAPLPKYPGWLSGAGTSRVIIGDHPEPDLSEFSGEVPEGDYLADFEAETNYFAVDRHGSLFWQENYFEYANVKAHIVEIIPESVGDAFKAYLRSRGVSYIIAGQEELDLELAMTKIAKIYDVDHLMLNGGPTLNWAALRAGLIDEISIVLMPVADAESDTHTLFESTDSAGPKPYSFSLKHLEQLEDGNVWLRYGVNYSQSD